MEKLTRIQRSAVMNAAKSIYPYLEKKRKIQEQIDNLHQELTSIDELIANFDTPVRNITGHSVTELVERKVVTLTNSDGSTKMDDKGNPIRRSTFVFRNLESDESTSANNEVEPSSETESANVESAETEQSNADKTEEYNENE